MTTIPIVPGATVAEAFIARGAARGGAGRCLIARLRALRFCGFWTLDLVALRQCGCGLRQEHNRQCGGCEFHRLGLPSWTVLNGPWSLEQQDAQGSGEPRLNGFTLPIYRVGMWSGYRFT